MSNNKVVFHIGENGDVAIYADGDVNVYWVSELTPNDRIYQGSPDPIPDGMLDGHIGHKNDDSPAAKKLSRLVREANGLPVFDVVK